jgi:hypothetical protein
VEVNKLLLPVYPRPCFYCEQWLPISWVEFKLYGEPCCRWCMGEQMAEQAKREMARLAGEKQEPPRFLKILQEKKAGQWAKERRGLCGRD